MRSRDAEAVIYFNDDLLDRARELEAVDYAERYRLTRLSPVNGSISLALDPAPVTLVKSPGIRPDAPLISSAAEAGINVIDEAELGWLLDLRPFIAITGTNGKSTVAKLTLALLESAGRTAELGGNTHFGPPLCALAGDGDYVVAEISSFQLEGCEQFLPDVALLTNLTHDHAYRHGSAERYAAVKRSMFIRGDHHVPAAAIGIDEPFGRELAAELRERGARVVTFGFAPDSDFEVLSVRSTPESSIVTVRADNRERELSASLPGRHNGQNIAAALALADLMDFDADRSAEVLARTTAPPGRFERVSTGSGPQVFVDFAHNPAGVASALDTARETLELDRGGRVIAVLSSLEFTGHEQGHACGVAAADRADLLVLTTHRARVHFRHGELAPGLLEGAQQGGRAELRVQPDRREAIHTAIAAAGNNDVVMILERGAASSPLFDANDVGTSFDDRVVARELLAELGHSV